VGVDLPPRRLVLFVEGKGDKSAVPALARRVLAGVQGNDVLFVDDREPFRVSGVGTLVKDDCALWRRWLSAAGQTRKNVGAVLLVLDGDVDRVPSTWGPYSKRYGSLEFCPYRVAAMLAHEARSSRAGEAFSLAIVFAMQEFEAWLLGGLESLRGAALAEGRGSVPTDAAMPDIDVEVKRNAKGTLRGLVPGYDQSLDQAVLAGKIDLSLVAKRCKSFRRLESAMRQLANAVRTGQAIVSPPI
jgi:hypothetical protein